MTQLTQDLVPALPDVASLPKVPGIRFRTFQDDADYGRLSELVATCNDVDDIPWLPTAQNLKTEIENNSAIDATRDILLAEIDGKVVASTNVERVVRDGVPLYDMDGYVLPALRRRGIGTALLDWAVERIRERALIEDPGVNVVVEGGADERETGHLALLKRVGFEPVRHFFLMRRASLDDVADAPLPDGLEIRTVETSQRRAIIAAEFEAFRDHWGSRDLTEDAIRRTLAMAELDTNLWVVAWDGDEIAGVVENWIWPDENDKLGVNRGWLERISVRRPWRRHGLARALTARSLIRLREAGMTEGMLGVDSENANGALGLYEGLGFELHSRSSAYRRPLELETD